MGIFICTYAHEPRAAAYLSCDIQQVCVSGVTSWDGLRPCVSWMDAAAQPSTVSPGLSQERTRWKHLNYTSRTRDDRRTEISQEAKCLWVWLAYGPKPWYKGRCQLLHASSPLTASRPPSSLCTPLPAPASSCPTRIQPRTPAVCGPKCKARLLYSVGATPWGWEWAAQDIKVNPGVLVTQLQDV